MRQRPARIEALAPGLCSWCGIRDATRTLYGSPTCTECAGHDRKFRVQAYLQRLKRATGAP